ncbi:hypothetical protein D3C80_1488840 [compost metagenome]
MATMAQAVGEAKAGRASNAVAVVIRFSGAATVSQPASAASGQIRNQRSRSMTPVMRMVLPLTRSGTSKARSEAKIMITLAAFRFRAAATIHMPMPNMATAEGQPMRLISTLSPVCGRACRPA